MDWLSYGAREYDPSIGRFFGVDPIAESFAHVTPYNYAENEPIANIDFWGLQKVSINDIRNDQGNIIKRVADVTINIKLLNLSSSSNDKFNTSLSYAKTGGQNSFSGSMNDRVLDSPQRGLTEGSIPIEVNFVINTTIIDDVSKIKDTDFVSAIVDDVEPKGNLDKAGWGSIDGNVSVVEAAAISKTSPKTLLHELGHNLGLGHSSKGLMKGEAPVTNSLYLSQDEKEAIYKGTVTGRNKNVRYSNTLANLRELISGYVSKYDSKKAKNANLD